jgi:hypothetical protein
MLGQYCLFFIGKLLTISSDITEASSKDVRNQYKEYGYVQETRNNWPVANAVVRVSIKLEIFNLNLKVSFKPERILSVYNLVNDSL